jgi:hypothetical protein
LSSCVIVGFFDAVLPTSTGRIIIIFRHTHKLVPGIVADSHAIVANAFSAAVHRLKIQP